MDYSQYKYLNAITKHEDGSTTINLPPLNTRGDYHIIHAYDQTLYESNIKNMKLKQLETWLIYTFPGQLPPDGTNNINKAANIYNSDMRQNFIDIINWLNDPHDN